MNYTVYMKQDLKEDCSHYTAYQNMLETPVTTAVMKWKIHINRMTMSKPICNALNMQLSATEHEICSFYRYACP